MKKFLSCLALALCVIFGAAFLSACGNGTKWLQPNFTYKGDELTIEFVNNAEKDFEFPVEGRKFEHSRFTDERILEYGWVIYDSDHELVGWIEADPGYDIDKKGNYKYGFSTSYNNGVYGYSNTEFCLVLKTTDLTVFDRLEITSDYGSVAAFTGLDKNPFPGSERFGTYDDKTGVMVPAAGSEKFVCCLYSLTLDTIDPDETQTITITLALKDNR